MSFSENLRLLRKEKNLSQEQLAELLNVSRQAVSKWEQGSGYPETEKLVLIAKKLNLSLDYLLLETETCNDNQIEKSSERKIMVKSFDGKSICAYHKFDILSMLIPSKNEPKCILIGIDHRTFFGEHNNTLGYYTSEKEAKKELQEILEAMENGDVSYALKYYANVKVGAIGVKLIEDN